MLTMCYDQGFKQAGKLGLSYASATMTEAVAEKFGVVKGACNLLFDEEGIGLPVCNVVLPAALSLVSGYFGGMAGSTLSNGAFKKMYYVIHGHKVNLRES